MVTLALTAIVAFALGAGAATLLWQSRLTEARFVSAALKSELARAAEATVELDNLRGQLKGLRHDIRGILSPAMLVSDRLLSHGEAPVKRAGEVMVRTVERAIQRLTETKLDAAASEPAGTPSAQLPPAPTSAQL